MQVLLKTLYWIALCIVIPYAFYLLIVQPLLIVWRSL